MFDILNQNKKAKLYLKYELNYENQESKFKNTGKKNVVVLAVNRRIVGKFSVSLHIGFSRFTTMSKIR